MQRLVWAGHSSKKLYDVIAYELSSRKDIKEVAEKKQAAWYAKSLATSGDEKYRSLLEDVAANASGKSVRKHAKRGLARIEKYRAWRPIISRGLVAAPKGRLEQTRVANMLDSANTDLLKIGAKRVYHQFSADSELVTKAKQRLGKEWNKLDAEDGNRVDAIAWLIKAVGSSGGVSNKALLSDIAEKSKIKKIRKHAKAMLKRLNKV